MSDNYKATGAQSLIDQFLKVNPFQVDWLKYNSKTPLTIYADASKELLAAAARQLQIQADYVAKLAQCDDPTDLLTVQTELVQKSVDASFESGRQIVDVVSKGFPAAS